MVGLALGLAAKNVQACNSIQGQGLGQLSGAGNWNVMRFEYNFQTGKHEVTAIWFDPSVASHTPQGGELVAINQNNDYELIYINISDGASGGGGGYTPPPIIHGSGAFGAGKVSGESKSTEHGIACGTGPIVGGGIVDRVTSIYSGIILPQHPWFKFDVLFPIGGGGGGGSSPSAGMSIPPSPANLERANCTDDEAERRVSAIRDVQQFCQVNPRRCRSETWPRATTVVVKYVGGVSEAWNVGYLTSSIITTPVPGSMSGCD